MARWTASAKWAGGPALDGQRDMPLALRLSEGLGVTARSIRGSGLEETRRVAGLGQCLVVRRKSALGQDL